MSENTKLGTAVHEALARGMGDAARLLHAKLLTQPLEARAEILRAFELSEGKATRAATLLGIGHRTLVRMMHDEAIARGIEEIRAKVARARAAKKAAAKR